MWQSLQDTVGPILAVIGTLAIGGGAITGFAFWLFKTFGEGWLSNRFAERLAAFRHEQSKELEQLKFEINKLFDRTTKLHQREFEVLPEAWSLLTTGYNRTRAFTSPLQSYPDISRMTREHLADFLSDAPLRDWQKVELHQAPDKNEYYQKAISWHRLRDAQTANRDAALYLLRYGIFMPPDIKDKFQQLDKLGMNALVEAEMNLAHDLIPRERGEFDKFWKEGEKLMAELEIAVQKRLWA